MLCVIRFVPWFRVNGPFLRQGWQCLCQWLRQTAIIIDYIDAINSEWSTTCFGFQHNMLWVIFLCYFMSPDDGLRPKLYSWNIINLFVIINNIILLQRFIHILYYTNNTFAVSILKNVPTYTANLYAAPVAFLGCCENAGKV